MSDKGLTERVDELEKKLNALVELMFLPEKAVDAPNFFGHVPTCARALNHANEALDVLRTNGIFMKK